ncbi:hypothetical protein RCH18_002484 [Flavobacterium sp. PL11]|jgi:hypothetical protein|uniref:hypothetical protein n=1 Tax=Flavobacterium sp. PL11 TaxID=3071717 RepID=UPI002E079294|nr:hypothetical protein [Flavobacterium sp. PL11]
MNHSSFIVKKEALVQELKNINKALGRKSKYNIQTVLELTITDNMLTLVVPGVKITIDCKTINTCKASIDFFYFKDIIDNTISKEIECIIRGNELQIGKTIFKVQTTFFENDSILRSIKLPINYTQWHVLQLEHKGYTLEELQFNNLEFVMYYAKKDLKKNILKAKEILGLYGVTFKEIEELVEKKIKI